MHITNKKFEFVGFLLFALLTILIALRITKGIDLTDEAYYAIFIDDWLKGGIRTSSFLTLHQTAALLVYPAALLYFKLKGSSDGLFLFLRVIFLLGSIITSIIWIYFLRLLGHRFLAWGGGLIILAFIPFGCPAPSYNSIGLQAFTTALGFFGCAAITKTNSKSQLWFIIASACAWSIATVAYPPLIFSMCAFFLSVFIYKKNFPFLKFYLVISAFILLSLWLLVIMSLSFSRLYNSIVYLAAVNEVGKLAHKLNFSFNIMKRNIIFTGLCIAALIVGICRQRLNPVTLQIVTGMIIACLCLKHSAFFAHSHDAITIATFTGIGLIMGLRRNAKQNERVIAMMYITSFIAALTTCITATCSIYNFCIGAIPAAVLAVVGIPSLKKNQYVHFFSVSILIIIILLTSLFFYYGETSSKKMREKVSEGVFAGVSASANDAALLKLIRNEVQPILKQDQTFAVFARLPGIALLMPSRLKMLISYPLTTNASFKAINMTHEFYAQLKNRPDMVIVYQDPYLELINPMQPHFKEWYLLLKKIKTERGQLSVFRRRV